MYFWDANATSRLRPVALEAVREILSEASHLNASSVHSEGRRSRALLREAREQVLSYLFPNSPNSQHNARLIFTSGGTESCNTLIKGFFSGRENFGDLSILTSAFEHAAILESISYYQMLGSKVRKVSPLSNGRIDPDLFLKEVTKNLYLVTLMLSNNETGVGQEVIEICRALKKNNPQTIFVSDISQAVSKTNLDLDLFFDAGVDAVALSAHKLGAMAGVGAVVFNTKSTCYNFEPLIHGGGQEDKMRGGTEFVIGAHIFGQVCKFLKDQGNRELRERRNLKTLLAQKISEKLPLSKIMFQEEEHPYDLCNTLYVRLPIRADDYAVALDLEGVKVSTGSACSSGRQDVSHVPLSLGYNKEEARNFFRIALDWDTTQKDISEGVLIMKQVLERFLSV